MTIKRRWAFCRFVKAKFVKIEGSGNSPGLDKLEA